MDDWLGLFHRAMAIMEATPPGIIPDDWTLGGGTMLFRRYHHRGSRDIDIFLPSPQSLAALSPRLNDEAERRVERGTYVEQSNFLKLAFDDGDIDFIVAPHLTSPYATREVVGGRPVWVETPAEILAKKVLYRADDFTARDLFDFAFLIGTGDAEALPRELRTYGDPLHRIRERLSVADAPLRQAFATIEALDYRPSYDDCRAVVEQFIRTTLR